MEGHAMPTPGPALADGWRKSSRSGDGGGGNCVEVKFDGDVVLIRDSKYLRNPANDPAEQPVITLSADKWETFIGAVAGKSTRSRQAFPRIEQTSRGVHLHSGNTTLTFTHQEWAAFTAGIHGGEFAAA
ncbi:DUF397 domain-containing protein [Nocardia cyriacigeorgica]|uniref:DUF397 domain-containing protein n=2 Tax=Nocardia cyriacigeorgica TaxID=135487 RepID=UPI000687AF86|nr:DUF397 domain-containing protein [Nocardia cyriacigeorgica]